MRTPYALKSTDELVITSEACEILGNLDRSTISRWVQLGKLTPAKRIRMGKNGAFLFRRADVEALALELGVTAPA